MPARSSADWEQVGTNEPDTRYDDGTASDSAVLTGYVMPEHPELVEPSGMGLGGPEDPQPFNPGYQLQTGLTDWINVRALGARGDGIADDTGIFQAANLIAQLPPGRAIFIPAGTYRLTANIVFSAGVQWLETGTVTITGGFTISGGTQLTFGGGGLTNPMTSPGDLIDGGTGGTPQRIPVGTNGQVLTVVSGAPAWSAGFTNPMVANGDIIIGGAAGAPTRLAVSANGQVLTLVSGAPAWAAASSGFSNPMTSTGDLIDGGSGGTPQRIPIGATGQVLTVVGGVPVWQSSVASAFTVVGPSGDTTGVTDTTNIQNALNGFTEVWLTQGTFFITGINVPVQQTASITSGQGSSLKGMGPATLIKIGSHGYATATNNAAINMHRLTNVGAQFGNAAQTTAGFLRDFVLDGTAAPAGSTGIDIGDGWNLDIDVVIVNFSGLGCIALYQINRVNFTEKCRFRATISNCANAVVFDQIAPGDQSHEFCDFDFRIFCNSSNGLTSVAQTGITVQNGAFLKAGTFSVRGNFGNDTVNPAGQTGQPAVWAVFNITGDNGPSFPSQIRWMLMMVKVEFNPGTGGSNQATTIVFGAGENFLTDCSGVMVWNGGVNSSPAIGNFQFRGTIFGDSSLSSVNTPTMPATSNTNYTNQQNDSIAYITGGSVTQIKVNGTVTGTTSGPVYVPANATIAIVWSVKPSWTWVSCY